MSSDLLLFSIALLAAVASAATGIALRERRAGRGLREDLAAAHDEAALLERRDDVTGLYNSRFFVEALTR